MSTTPKPPSVPWDDVPENQRAPNGMFHQAPAEYGGEGWVVNPFTGKEPWKQWAERYGGGPTKPTLPDDFTRVFGPRPAQKTSADYFEHRLQLMQWEHALKTFVRTGTPEGIDPEALAEANATYEAWGMGPITFVESRHGWRAYFPEQSVIPGFDVDPQSAVLSPHNHVAIWQIRTVQRGGQVPGENRHPWVPPHVWKD